MMQTPRIRSDLQATPAEEQGIKYFDVSDPRSGAHMRMYDFEWLIAARMDGARPFDEVALWARERLGIQPSAADLEEYAHRLRELGFFEIEARAGLHGNREDEVAIEEEPPADEPTATVYAPSSYAPGSAGGALNTPLSPALASPTPAFAGSVTPSGSGAFAAVPPGGAPSSLLASSPSGRNLDDDKPTAQYAAITDAPSLTGPSSSLSYGGGSGPVASPPVDAGPRRSTPFDSPAVQDTGRLGAAAPEKRSGGGLSLWLLLLVVVVVAALVYYVMYMNNSAAKVTTTMASPREGVRRFDPSASLQKNAGQVLAFGEAGKVAEVVAAGAEVHPGQTLATLDGYAKVEKDLRDVRDRASFYEKQLENAKAKSDAGAVRAAEAKVAEKHKLAADLEARAAKLRLLAPAAGAVDKALVAVGGEVKPGQPVVQFANKSASAEFHLAPADAATLKPGVTVSLRPTNGGALLAGRVAKVEGGNVTIDVSDDTARHGEAVQLVKERVPNVVPLPAAALVKHDGTDVVFVFADGAVHERKVSVVDRSDGQAWVASGLANGDQVVVAGAESLHDGQKATQ